MLEASTRFACRFVVTVVNCYTGRWSELHVDPDLRKRKMSFEAAILAALARAKVIEPAH
jgi:hypothetical protein